MSFSSETKEILCKTEYECPACRLAELAGFFAFSGNLSENDIYISSHNAFLADRINKALYHELGIKTLKTGKRYILSDEDKDKLKCQTSGDVCIYECCKMSYIRGAFLGGGSVNAPGKKYHIEFGSREEENALSLASMLEEYDLKPKITNRKDKFVVYIKESAQIVDLLGYMSGGRAGLEFLSVQVEKEIKSRTQRCVNCDSANLNKLAMASSRHIAAIKKIKSARKWQSLPDVLKEIGELRLKYPDLSLEVLGTMTEQKIGKSGVNHRLNRLVEYASCIGKD